MSDEQSYVYAISDRPGVLLCLVPTGDGGQSMMVGWRLELHVVERHGAQMETRVIELAHFHDYKRMLIARRWLSDAFDQIDRAKQQYTKGVTPSPPHPDLGGSDAPPPWTPPDLTTFTHFDPNDIDWDKL